FDQQDEEPLGPMANLVDIMLVFAVGLIAAIVANSPEMKQQLMKQRQVIEKGKELPQMPSEAGQSGSGYESVGRVYRDSKTGKLILIGEDNKQ
ncbi:MAG: DUF2149 domain-containing protein, partial [Gammaproteobacteria bacterium]|nr:DUF2149 domain-containing protein [Gammaproteobacteria bacterium]